MRHAAIARADQDIVRETALSTEQEGQSFQVTHVSESQVATDAAAPRSYADMVWGPEELTGGEDTLHDDDEHSEHKRIRSDDESSPLRADKRGKPEIDSQSQDLFSSPEDQGRAADVLSVEAAREDPPLSIDDNQDTANAGITSDVITTCNNNSLSGAHANAAHTNDVVTTGNNNSLSDANAKAVHTNDVVNDNSLSNANA